VNKPASYEIAITEKLQKLPVPDMMDTIWNSIERQLDEDLPVNDDTAPNNGPHSGGMSGVTKIIGGTAIIITAVVIVYYSLKKHDVPKSNNTLPLIELPQPPRKNTEQSIKDLRPETIEYKSVELPKNKKLDTMLKLTLLPIPIPVTRSVADSLKRDSIQNQMLPQVILPKPDSQAGPVQKKPKGVKGITPDDYKIKGGSKN